MDEKIVERKRMNHYVSAEAAEDFEEFFENQDPPLSKQVLYELTLTRGMYFDGDRVLELKTLIGVAYELLTNRAKYLPAHWDETAEKVSDKLAVFMLELETVK